MNRSILFLSAVILITGISSAELPELIPREVLFGNPERVQPQLSPCGEYIAYVAPVDDVMNVWVMNIDGSEPRQITFDTNRGVRMYFWAENGKHILYMQDEAGEENYHVYMLDVVSGELLDLTPFEGVRAFVAETDKDFPNMVHINMNQNNPMYFDVYEADLETGELTMIEENPGNVLGYMSDEDMVIKLAYTMDPMNGDIGILIRDSPEDEWREFMSFSSTESVEPLRFSKDGSGIYIRSNLNSNTTQLLYHDFASGEETLIIQDELADVGGVSFDPFRIVPRSVSFNYLRRRVEILDASIQADYEYMETVSEGDFFVASRDNADSTWIVGYYTVFNPVSYFVYDRTVKNAEYLFSAIPELENYELSDMEPVLIEARDGLLLPSYLTLPSGLEPRNLPMVLYVHGGPWYRDYYGYEPFVQLMANRGFAVLRVNFRASTGFGKEFMNAGNQEWGAAMQDDLTDAVNWAIEEGYADPERVVILGGSYGGYAALVGATFTPDLYCAAVDFFGPSNLITFRETVPVYWRPMDALFDNRIGSIEDDREMLEERSPLNFVENIRIPLFVVQGANDPRVVQAESDQMVEALRAIGTEVYYVIYEDEGHGFAHEKNNLDFAGRVDEFLAEHIPGVRYEPYVEVEGSTALEL